MKILLVQTSFLGDVVLSTAVISAIKKLYPQSELWMMTTPLGAGLVRPDPELAGVIEFDKRGKDSGLMGLLRMAARLRSMQFDRVYALQRALRTSLLLALAKIPHRTGFSSARLSFLYHVRVPRPADLHDVMRNLSLLSAEAPLSELPQELRLTVPAESELSEAVRVCLSKSEPYVLIVPGSAWRTKMWHWQRVRELVHKYVSLGRRVVLVGAGPEVSICERVAEGQAVENLAGKTSIADLVALIARASVLICNDSSALQISSALKTPTVVVFCATSPSFGFGPWKNKAMVIEREGLPCKPCRRHGSAACPTGTEACMREVPAQRVFAAAESIARTGEAA
ncbi:MAG: lipopolysaccharide heptosyltransferase II [Oligoflexia bacterium]|nr:lipopolysaccharide heptosyltransferase II [Oligoflexia bacterium]